MKNLPEIFGSLAFNEVAMRERLPEESFAALRGTMERGVPMTPQLADVVAMAMKDWAVERALHIIPEIPLR